MKQNQEPKQLRQMNEILGDIFLNSREVSSNANGVNGVTGAKRSFDGWIGENIFFGGNDISRKADMMRDSTIINLVECLDESRQRKPLCLINLNRTYQHKILKNQSVTSVITLVTPQSNTANDLDLTRYQGKTGTLNIIHAAQEDPDLFIDNLYDTVDRSKSKTESEFAQKLSKLNISTEVHALDHSREM